MGLASQGQRFARKHARDVVTGVYAVGTSNEKRLWTESAKGSYRESFFVPGCNNTEVRMGGSSSHARPPIFLRACE